MASEALPRLRPRVRRRSQAAASRSEDALEGFGPLPTLDEVVDRPDVLEDERCSALSRGIVVVEERQHEARHLRPHLRERLSGGFPDPPRGIGEQRCDEASGRET